MCCVAVYCSSSLRLDRRRTVFLVAVLFMFAPVREVISPASCAGEAPETWEVREDPKTTGKRRRTEAFGPDLPPRARGSHTPVPSDLPARRSSQALRARFLQ